MIDDGQRGDQLDAALAGHDRLIFFFCRVMQLRSQGEDPRWGGIEFRVADSEAAADDVVKSQQPYAMALGVHDRQHRYLRRAVFHEL